MTKLSLKKILPALTLCGALPFIDQAQALPSCQPIALLVKHPHIKPARKPQIRLDIYQISHLDFPQETINLNLVSALSTLDNVESIEKETNWYSITWKPGVKLKKALNHLKFPELKIDHRTRIVLNLQKNIPLETGLYSENLPDTRPDYFREIFSLNVKGEGELGGIKNHVRFFESDVQDKYFTLKEMTKLNLGLNYLKYFNPINNDVIQTPDVMKTHRYDIPKEKSKTRLIIESLPNNKMLMEFVTYIEDQRS